MNIDRAIHIIRNPYGFSEADQREARLLCATELDKFLPKARTAWQVIRYGEDRYGIFAGQEQIAMLYRFVVSGKIPGVMGRPNEQETSWSKNTEANARLIAAAPAMLEALERLAEFGNREYFSVFLPQIQAAIAKAKGGAE